MQTKIIKKRNNLPAIQRYEGHLIVSTECYIDCEDDALIKDLKESGAENWEIDAAKKIPIHENYCESYYVIAQQSLSDEYLDHLTEDIIFDFVEEVVA